MSQELGFCPNCSIGLNNRERELRFYQNCEHNWQDDQAEDEMEWDEEEVSCKSCGEPKEWQECWSCGGDGGRGYDDDLQFEDPLWYSPGDFVKCSECNGAGGFHVCTNDKCSEE